MSRSKVNRFIDKYLDENGKSQLIRRYDLEVPFYYTSGDGIFRMDARLGKYINIFL